MKTKIGRIKPLLKNYNYRVMKNYAEHLAPTDIPHPRKIKNGDKILLMRLSAIGDAIRMLPVVEYLRNNGFTGRVDCVVQSPIADFLRPVNRINEVHELKLSDPVQNFSGVLSQIQKIRRLRYDWLFDFHGLLKSGILSVLSGAKQRVGYSRTKSREFNYFFQTLVPVEPLPERMPRILKYVQLIRPFTEEFAYTRDQLRPQYPPVSPSTRELRKEATQRPVLVQPFSSHGRYGTSKEWGTENFVELLEQLDSELDGPIHVTWGPGEQRKAQDLVQRTGGDVEVAAGTNNLKDLAYQVSQARMVISVDTSVAHVSDLLGTPLVVLFGGSNPYINGPLFTNYRIVNRRAGEPTIREIPVTRVLKCVLDLFQSVDLQGA